jgi:hypothetical protein
MEELLIYSQSIPQPYQSIQKSYMFTTNCKRDLNRTTLLHPGDSLSELLSVH